MAAEGYGGGGHVCGLCLGCMRPGGSSALVSGLVCGP